MDSPYPMTLNTLITHNYKTSGSKVYIYILNLTELLIVFVWAVKLNLLDLMNPNQPKRSYDRTFISKLLNTCDCQMDKLLALSLCNKRWVRREVFSSQWMCLKF